MNFETSFSIRLAAIADQAAWTILYSGYRGFYGLTPDAEIVGNA